MTQDARTPRYALVTGGSSGIGLETARGLVSTFDVVGIVGRNLERLESGAQEIGSAGARIETFQADFSSLADVSRLADEVGRRFESLSALVNNAGAWHTQRTLSKDGYEDTFAVNHLAHFLLTNRLKDLLLTGAPARVVNVSSSTHRNPKGMNWDDLMFERGWSGFKVYGHSKLANVLFSNELARRWDGAGITVNALHPGNVRSRITRHNAFLNALHRSPVARLFILSEADGALTSIHCATSPALNDVSGRFFEKSKEVAPAPAALDTGAAKRLWEISEQLVDAAQASSRVEPF